MRKTSLTLALVLLVVFNLSALGALLYYRWGAAASANEPPAQARHRFLQKELGLTEAQLAQTEALREALVKKVSPLQRQLRDKNAELMRHLRAEENDPDRIDALLDEIATLQRQVQELAVDHLLQQAKLLRPEQREQFFRLLEEGLCPVEGHPGRGPGIGLLGDGRCADEF